MTNFEKNLYEALSNLNSFFLNMPKVSVDPESSDLEKLTVPMLRSRLARAGKAKGTTAFKKNDLIKILRGEEVARKHKKIAKAASPARKSPARSSPKLGLLIDDSPARSSPKSPARKSPAKSPKRSSLAKSPAKSPKRSSLAKSPARSSPKAPAKRIPPPPLPRDPIPAIVQGVASACATSDRKEAKRIIKCLCKKFPDIVRCAKKGEKVKKGEIGIPVFSPPRSPPKSPKPPSSPAPAPPIPPPPPAPKAVQHHNRINLLHDIVANANKLAKKEKLCPEGQRFSKKKALCVDRKVKTLHTENPLMNAIAKRMGIDHSKSPKRKAGLVSPSRSVAVASSKPQSPERNPVPVRTSIVKCKLPEIMNSYGKCSCPLPGQKLSKDGVCVDLATLIKAGELETFGNEDIKKALVVRRGKQDEEDEEEW
jgi:hypothetical protein